MGSTLLPLPSKPGGAAAVRLPGSGRCGGLRLDNREDNGMIVRRGSVPWAEEACVFPIAQTSAALCKSEAAKVITGSI